MTPEGVILPSCGRRRAARTETRRTEMGTITVSNGEFAVKEYLDDRGYRRVSLVSIAGYPFEIGHDRYFSGPKVGEITPGPRNRCVGFRHPGGWSSDAVCLDEAAAARSLSYLSGEGDGLGRLRSGVRRWVDPQGVEHLEADPMSSGSQFVHLSEADRSALAVILDRIEAENLAARPGSTPRSEAGEKPSSPSTRVLSPPRRPRCARPRGRPSRRRATPGGRSAGARSAVTRTATGWIAASPEGGDDEITQVVEVGRPRRSPRPSSSP